MKLRHLALVSALAVAAASSAQAAPIVFDFESLALGHVSSASQTVGGLTASIDSLGGTFDVVSTPFAGFGGRSLISYSGFGAGAGPLVVDFSGTVTGVSISGTDYTPSDVDNVWLQAWSGAGGTGTLLGMISGPDCCSTTSTPSTVFLGMGGIKSVVFWTSPGATFPGALYFDNLTVESFVGGGVPEPATWALMIGGFGLAGAALRRRRAIAA